MRCDSSGWTGSYQQREAQLHIRSAEPRLDGVQGAAISEYLTELPIGDVVAEYEQSRQALAGHPARPPQDLAWVLLSPIVVARIVSRLSRAFIRHRRGSALAVGALLGGTRAVTLVDDSRPGTGFAGSPFDDEGVARRRVVLLSGGRVAALLGCRDAGPTTGSAYWGDWESDVTAATSRCYLEPSSGGPAPRPADLDGCGLVAWDLRGFRGGLQLESGCIEFELAGAVVCDNRVVGSAVVEVSAPPAGFLEAFDQVFTGTKFYRIQGLYGGSWALLKPSVVQNVQ